MRFLVLTSVAFSVAALPAIAIGAQQKASGGPEATYWVSAETASGLAAGTPTGVTRKLQLQLGSGRKAAGQPLAEHLPPSGLQAGASLPLSTPAVAAGPGRAIPAASFDPSKIKGKMLIYWGCGEQARAGQPLAVDLATMAAGKASLSTAMINVAAMMPPAPGRHASYGEWPNSQGGNTVPASSSLVGEHFVRGNYTPDIKFALGPTNDFLEPLSPKSASLSSGAVRVSWPTLAQAKAYGASVIGSTGDGTVIIWSSSEVRMVGTALPDYLAQGDIDRLVQQKALLSPRNTECAVPAEVVKATRGAMLQMTAYGPEANFAAPRGTLGGWTVKVRSKATHMGMLGAETPQLSEQQNTSRPASEILSQPIPSSRARLLKGIGSVFGARH